MPTAAPLRPLELRTEGEQPGFARIILRSPRGFVVEVHASEVGWMADLLGRRVAEQLQAV